MEFSIKLDTVKPGRLIVYIVGSQVIISKKSITFLSLKTDFDLTNSAASDEMSHYTGYITSSGSSLFATS